MTLRNRAPTTAALALCPALRSRPRAARAVSGLAFAVVTVGAFVWLTDHLGDGAISELPPLLLFGTGAGLTRFYRAVRGIAPEPAALPDQPPPRPPPSDPMLPPWARNVTPPRPDAPR